MNYWVNCHANFGAAGIHSGKVSVRVNEAFSCSGTGLDWQSAADNAAGYACLVLNSLGYRSDLDEKIDLDTRGKDIMPFYDIFYFIGHCTWIAPDHAKHAPALNLNYSTNEIVRDRVSHATPAGVQRKYRFVFLNCCDSAMLEYQVPDFQEAFQATCLLGWRCERPPVDDKLHGVTPEHTLAFSDDFWWYVAGGWTVKQAAYTAHLDNMDLFFIDVSYPVVQGSDITLAK